jgi:predicted PolB exonuclease-like 3'-5' exonuclease
MNLFVFDIETVPDVDAGRRLYDLGDLPDVQVAEIMFHKQREVSGNEFLRHHLHRVVAISVVLRSSDRFKLWSLGDAGSPEEELIQRFFEGLERYSPTLVSWNGSGFDLPVLHYRSLLHGIVARRYWETGADDSSFRWNNYLSRFHERHTDLMDVLAGHQPRAGVALQDMALLLGLPGKLGMHGSMVWERFLDGGIESIRNYCETDVLNTFLVYLRFELVRGHLSEEAYERECERLRGALAEDGRPHIAEFLAAWSGGRSS